MITSAAGKALAAGKVVVSAIFEQKRGADQQTERIKVAYGKLRVQTLVFEVSEGLAAKGVKVNLAGADLPAKFVQSVNEIHITLAEPTVMETDKVLNIDIETGKK